MPHPSQHGDPPRGCTGAQHSHPGISLENSGTHHELDPRRLLANHHRARGSRCGATSAARVCGGQATEVQWNFIPRSHTLRSFESEFRKRCTKKLDGARKNTPVQFKIQFDSNSEFLGSSFAVWAVVVPCDGWCCYASHHARLWDTIWPPHSRTAGVT